jgi:hypothetical protein
MPGGGAEQGHKTLSVHALFAGQSGQIREWGVNIAESDRSVTATSGFCDARSDDDKEDVIGLFPQGEFTQDSLSSRWYRPRLLRGENLTCAECLVSTRHEVVGKRHRVRYHFGPGMVVVVYAAIARPNDYILDEILVVWTHGLGKGPDVAWRGNFHVLAPGIIYR